MKKQSNNLSELQKIVLALVIAFINMASPQSSSAATVAIEATERPISSSSTSGVIEPDVMSVEQIASHVRDIQALTDEVVLVGHILEVMTNNHDAIDLSFTDRILEVYEEIRSLEEHPGEFAQAALGFTKDLQSARMTLLSNSKNVLSWFGLVKAISPEDVVAIPERFLPSDIDWKESARQFAANEDVLAYAQLAAAMFVERWPGLSVGYSLDEKHGQIWVNMDVDELSDDDWDDEFDIETDYWAQVPVEMRAKLGLLLLERNA